jgi:hypothetical protein
MTIFLDVDDTLGDFRGHAIDLGVPPWEGSWYTTDPATWTQEQKDIQKATNDIMRTEKFWLTMPVTPGAHELIAAAFARDETYLLTALPSFAKDDETQDMIRRVKLEYARNTLHIPHERVIICQRKDKVNYATRNGFVDAPNLLVDDAEQNIREWIGSGGHAIHHTTVSHSIRAVKAHYGR